MTPDEYCQQKAVQSGSSFYYSFLFLPRPRRRAITALYAFCREVDSGEPTLVDPYASEHPAEFFAVMSEMFFTDSGVLWRDWPDLYRQLGLFYRQNPQH